MGDAMPVMRRAVFVGLFAVAIVAVPTPASAVAEGVYAGTCTVRLDLAFATPSGPLPVQTTARVSGSGMCATNVGLGALAIQGTVSTVPALGGFACSAGALFGSAVVNIDVPGFPDPLVQVRIVNNGASATVAFYALLVTFEGVAELAHDPQHAASCATGTPLASTSWTGAMAFQDPVLPPLTRAWPEPL